MKEAGNYRVTHVVREACIFACHDLKNDPPFSHLDLIRCRDVVAYLEPVLQKRVLSTFFFALRDAGILVLGEPETPDACSDLFKMVDAKTRSLMKRTGVASRRGGVYGLLSDAAKHNGIKHNEIIHSKDELTHTREDLQSIIQQYEIVNRELSSANEEAVSSMEELQSVNAELESAKDELQSANEELTVLNEQAPKRSLDLAKLTDDLTNILEGVGIPIVISGGDRRIRWATPNAEKVLHVRTSDTGRPLGDIRMGLVKAVLEDSISAVLRERRELEQEVRGEDGRWYSLRLCPCWTGAGKVDGVLLALLDVHALKESQEAARKQERFVSAILDAAGWTLLVVALDPEGRIVHFNRACQVLNRLLAGGSEGQAALGFPDAPGTS